MVPGWFYNLSRFQVGFQWFQVGFYGFLWVQVNFSWFLVDFYGFSWFQVDPHGPRSVFHGVRWVFYGFMDGVGWERDGMDGYHKSTMFKEYLCLVPISCG